MDENETKIIVIKRPEIKCPECNDIMTKGNGFWCPFFSCDWYDCPKCNIRIEVRG